MSDFITLKDNLYPFRWRDEHQDPVTAIGLWIFKMIALQPRREGAPVAASGQFLPSRSRLDATGSDRSLVKRYIRPLNRTGFFKSHPSRRQIAKIFP
jgi:hypothetical protein